MNVKKTVAIAALILTAVAVGFAADPNVGTWKLDEAKSKIPAGAAKNITVVYTAAGDSYKCVVDGVDAAGKPAHNEWTGKFDGKDYPVTGDPFSDTRSYTPVGDRTLDITIKKDGQVVLTGQMTLSDKGKSRRTTTKGKDASGQDISSSAVYEKQ